MLIVTKYDRNASLNQVTQYDSIEWVRYYE